MSKVFIIGCIEEFIEVNSRSRSFTEPSIEIIDDRIIRDWRKKLADW